MHVHDLCCVVLMTVCCTNANIPPQIPNRLAIRGWMIITSAWYGRTVTSDFIVLPKTYSYLHDPISYIYMTYK